MDEQAKEEMKRNKNFLELNENENTTQPKPLEPIKSSPMREIYSSSCLH